jgi:hypothetical protein
MNATISSGSGLLITKLDHTLLEGDDFGWVLAVPTRSIFSACYARAACDQAVAAPPKSVMNSRRRIFLPPPKIWAMPCAMGEASTLRPGREWEMTSNRTETRSGSMSQLGHLRPSLQSLSNI